MTADNRKAALEELAAFCRGIIPTEIGRYPTAQDGIELASDLRLFAERVDRVVAAYGDYADSTIGGMDADLFTDQLAGALEGNAIYEIESGAKDAEEARREPDPDAGYDAIRDMRAERRFA